MSATTTRPASERTEDEKAYVAAFDRAVGLMMKIEDLMNDLPSLGTAYVIDADDVDGLNKVCGLLEKAKAALGG